MTSLYRCIKEYRVTMLCRDESDAVAVMEVAYVAASD
jgi:hypothetical protein